MAGQPSSHTSHNRKVNIREALDPIIDSYSRPSTSMNGLDYVSKAIMAPFTHRKADSSKILADLAPSMMTPRIVNAAVASTTKSRAVTDATSKTLNFGTLRRAPMQLALGTRRITSADLQIIESADELLAAEIPEPEGVASDVSLLRGFNATVPSSERGKARRRQMRNIEGPKMGLKKLGMSARGLLMDEEDEGSIASASASVSVASEDDEDIVVVGRSGKGKGKLKLRPKRRGRESLGESVRLGKEELSRQLKEIMRDKENIHVRRALVSNEITEVTNKISALDAIRQKLQQDLLKLQEDELELEDELEGVRERLDFEESINPSKRSQQIPYITQSSRRRKGPAFLPSEHDDLPPGIAFMTLASSDFPTSTAVSALDFSEPYGTLVAAYQEDSGPRVWDLLTAEEIGRLRGHTGMVKALQVEEHLCLTGSDDSTVRVWDLRRVGDELTREDDALSMSSVPEEDESVVDGEMVHHPHEPNGIRNGHTKKGKSQDMDYACMKVLEGHSKSVTALYFEDNCLVTGASDKTLRQWDLTTGQCVMTMDILWALAHPPSLTASTPSFSLLPGTASAIGHFAVPTPPYADGSWDMYQDFVGAVQFWGYALVSGSGDGAVRMWDMRTGQAHRSLLGHTAPVTCLQFDEMHVVSGGLDKTVRIWDLRTGGIFDTIKYDHGVTALQFDSRKIVSAAGENGIKIYNRTTMQHSALTTNGHTKPVERLRYMDRYLVSGGRDSALKIWAL